MNAHLVSAYQQCFAEPQRSQRRLYEMAKRDQWNSDALPWDRLDFSALPPPLREALSGLCAHVHYGEVASLLAAARAVEQADDSESRLFASTQVIDEARHVEWFTRLQQKLAPPEPPTVHETVTALVDSVYASRDPDELCLGMQLIVEGLAQTLFQEAARALRGIDRAFCEASRGAQGAAAPAGPASAAGLLADWLSNYIARDESRHVAFGVVQLGQRLRRLPSSRIDALQAKVEVWGQLLQAIPAAFEPRFATLGIDTLRLAGDCISDLNLHLRQAGLEVQLTPPTALYVTSAAAASSPGSTT